MVASALQQFRERLEWTQQEVVDALHKLAWERDRRRIALDVPMLSKWETGRKRPSPYYRELLCTLYAATPEALGFRRPLPVQAAGTVPALDEDDDVDLNRKQLFAGIAGAVTATVKLPDLAWAGAPRSIGEGEVRRVGQWLDVLWDLDDQHGAVAARPLAIRTVKHLGGLADRASYNAATGRALHEMRSHATRLVAWIAYDTGDNREARRSWNEALTHARLAESEPAAAQILGVMSQEATRAGRAREAVDMAQAAGRAAAATGTPPHLTSVILGREAVGHAHNADASATRDALRRARALSERDGDDPSRPGFFWGPEQVAYHEARAARALDDLNAAERAARIAVNSSLAPATPVLVQADCLAHLADILVRRGMIDEGVAVARRAGTLASELESARVVGDVHSVARRLVRHERNRDVREFLDWTRQTLAV